MAKVVLLGTCDTKLDELLFLRSAIVDQGLGVILMDVGRDDVEHNDITFARNDLIGDFGEGVDTSNFSRGDLMKHMSFCATKAVRNLYSKDMISAIVSAGGSGGTSIASSVLRDALPIGFPKLIVSTIASGDTGPIVGETDITLMYSVVDIAGLNELLREVLQNAAAAIAGMAKAYTSRRTGLEGKREGQRDKTRKRVGITMFGVTTPAVDTIRHHLSSRHEIECYIFHATGHGGKAMERLIRAGRLDAVLDLTTTEICDELTGGNMSAGSDRLEAAIEAGIPNIVSLGATDMSNFGPKGTVPERYRGRKLYVHNEVVTLMRTNKDEAKMVGDVIVGKLYGASRKELVEVWIPRGGASMISTAGGPFEDREADEILFETIKRGLKGSGIKIVDDKRAINDAGFAVDIAERLAQIMGLKR